MSLGIYLTGRCGAGRSGGTGPLLGEKPERRLDRVEQWLRASCADTLVELWRGKDDERRPFLAFQLHPQAAAVQLVVAGRGRAEVVAATSSVGPGYHAYLCDVVRGLGEAAGIQWDATDPEGEPGDDTGYFAAGDYAALEREMLSWLAGLARLALEEWSPDTSEISLGLPLETRYAPVPGAVLTALGPRDRVWLEAAAAEPRRGIDFFPWWERGQTARTRRDRALCRIWCEVRWRPPLDDEEQDRLLGVLALLEAAYRQDPGLDYPWREWEELNGLAGVTGPLPEEVSRRAAASPPGRPIGYRRSDVRAGVGEGWFIAVPGSLADGWEDEGRTWVAWDAEREVRVSIITVRGREGEAPPAEALLEVVELAEGTPVESAREPMPARAVLSPPEPGAEDDFWQLQGVKAVPGIAAFCTIVFSPTHREWAEAAWRTLNRPEQEA